MTTLAANKLRSYELGDDDDVPVVASDIIFEGAAAGDNGSGYARPLVGGDKFLGFANKKADNSAGAAGAVYVNLRRSGFIELAVSGAVITDVGQPVYLSDDDTATFSPVGASFCGIVKRFVSSGIVVVEFGPDLVDPYGWATKRELVAANKTLDAEDTGKTFFVNTDAVVVTLPATATALSGVTVVNIGAFGAVGLSLSPQAADKVMGPDLAGTDNKDLINTKATARRGDFVTFNLGHADGAVVTAMRGTWATEA